MNRTMAANIKFNFCLLCLLFVIKKSTQSCFLRYGNGSVKLVSRYAYGYYSEDGEEQPVPDFDDVPPLNSSNECYVVFKCDDGQELPPPRYLPSDCDEIELSIRFTAMGNYYRYRHNYRYGPRYPGYDELRSSYERIVTLDLSNNDLSQSGFEMARLCPRVSTIHLKNTSLNVLSDYYFNSLDSLKVLDLEENHLSTVLVRNGFPPNLEELYLQHNALGFRPLLFLQSLSNLTTLNLVDNQITTIEKDLFTVMRSLKKLYLNDNLIERFENNVLENLETFDISNNPIKILDVKMPKCKYLSAAQIGLTDLNPTTNGIALLGNNGETNIKLNTTYLEHLDLSHNELTSINISVFQKSTELTYLNLSFNSIKQIVEVSPLNKLLQLDLQSNKIDYLNATIIAKSENLYYLNLRDNNIKSIDPHLLESFTNLQYLYLDQNQLSKIDFNLFNNNINIKHLNLSNNFMSNLVLNQSLNLQQLETLDLHNNHFTESVFRVFLNNPQNLYYLDLKNNLISHIEGLSSKYLFSLNYFDISLNYLTTINNHTFATCNNVTELHLNNNHIRNIEPDGLLGLQNLKTLYLQVNNLRALSTSIFRNNLQLETLNLSHNLITHFGNEVFQNLPRLNVLELQNNKITNIPANSFTGCRRLGEINLEHNKIKQIEPNAFSGLAINNLRLHDNKLTSIGGAFHGIQTIYKLDLSKNLLSTLYYGTFDDARELRLLNISHNKIEEIPEMIFKNNYNLKELYLDNNKLKALELRAEMHLSTISLHNNPWNCKNLTKLIQVLKENEATIINENPVFDTHNIERIGCENKNRFVDVNNEYFSSLLSNVNQNLEKANISTLLDNELGNSEFYKYFKKFNGVNFLRNFENRQNLESPSSKYVVFLKKLNGTYYDYINKLQSIRDLNNRNKLLTYESPEQTIDNSLAVFLTFNIAVLIVIFLALIISVYFVVFKKISYCNIVNVSRGEIEHPAE